MIKRTVTPQIIHRTLLPQDFSLSTWESVLPYFEKVSAQEIIDFQHVIRKIPVADNVIEYAVTLVSKTRPDNPLATDFVKTYIDWGAGPRASQNLILAAKTNAALNGKFSPDIEDVQAVAIGILRHRIVKNYKADAEGITEETIIKKLL